MALDYYKLISDREGEMSELFSRMDADKDLIILKEYAMSDKDSLEVPDVDNITLNDAQVFWNRVKSTIIAANMQPEVTGKNLNDKDTTLVENFIDDVTYVIDTRLQNIGKSSLLSYNIEQICGRGRIGTRVCLRMNPKTGLFVADILPIDTKYLIYEAGIDGLKWAAAKFSRSKAKILDEYGIEITSTSAVVADFFDEEYERVFIDQKLAEEKKHPYGEVPFAIQLCPAGLSFSDDDIARYEGESIFAPNRNLYEMKNKLGTILMTLSILSFHRGMQYASDAGVAAPKPQSPPYGKKVVIPVEKGGGYSPMPLQDVTNATRWLYQMIEDALQKGALPAVSYGSLTFPLSAVAITALTEAEDPVYTPRLQALAMYYRNLYKMIIRQYIKLEMNAEIGRDGFQTEYPYKELDKAYSISFKFFTTSPKQNIANYSVAQAARNFISDDTIRRNILQLEDPSGEEAKRVSEMADRLIPNLQLYKMAKAKIEAGLNAEAQMIAMQLGMTLQEIQSGKLSTAPPQAGQPQAGQAPQPQQNLLPLMGQGGSSMVRPTNPVAAEAPPGG